MGNFWTRYVPPILSVFHASSMSAQRLLRILPGDEVYVAGLI